MILSAKCFKIHRADNVATLLDDAAPGPISIIGEVADGANEIDISAAIQLGHKVALEDLEPGQAVIKFGVPIGKASTAIARGEWIHLHNCQSNFDARSGTLDLHSGATMDTKYE